MKRVAGDLARKIVRSPALCSAVLSLVPNRVHSVTKALGSLTLRQELHGSPAASGRSGQDGRQSRLQSQVETSRRMLAGSRNFEARGPPADFCQAISFSSAPKSACLSLPLSPVLGRVLGRHLGHSRRDTSRLAAPLLLDKQKLLGRGPLAARALKGIGLRCVLWEI